ncbi:hypothetical protein XSR1_110003 [Xenorhabdus szentirmaii DSM 16338]|uniref:Uncharacterized protein n=1 Tax=Xenorhabdus szentirmaii DSM 16338 TaxID=1427518 RepID=W1IV77_9GAMM|nr:hypothetical protein XSR1_110003 [Xenorhabdus szentirmaii DSM 16338]
MKRMASREEVAKTVAFLLSDESSFTTGLFTRLMAVIRHNKVKDEEPILSCPK